MKKFSRKSPSQPVDRHDLSHRTKKEKKRPSHQPNVLEPALSERSPEIGEHRSLTRIAPLPNASAPLASSHDIITELARTGAKQILAAALEQEVSEYIEQYAKNRDEHGHQQIVRNGHCEPRNLLTGIGNIEIEQPRVRDKREKSEREKFTSQILPPYLRKVKTLDEFIPILYLRGVSTGDMESTLRALLVNSG